MIKLSNNFPMSFGPNRLSLVLLLKFVSEHSSATISDIVEETGISNGKSTGKVVPFLTYLSGMGLINFSINQNVYSFELTDFGKVVKKEDFQMSLSLTQWICHANLCNAKWGSDVWLTFFDNWNATELRDLERISRNSKIGKKKYTPLLAMYLNDNAFSYAQIIEHTDQIDFYKRNKAPLKQEYFPGYGAICIQLIEEMGKEQVTIPEFERKMNFSNTFGWDVIDSEIVYEKLCSLGYIKIDNFVNPKCIQPLRTLTEAFDNLYMNVL